MARLAIDWYPDSIILPYDLEEEVTETPLPAEPGVTDLNLLLVRNLRVAPGDFEFRFVDGSSVCAHKIYLARCSTLSALIASGASDLAVPSEVSRDSVERVLRHLYGGGHPPPIALTAAECEFYARTFGRELVTEDGALSFRAVPLMREHLAATVGSPLYADVALVFDDGEFPAHKAVLCGRSLWFASAFANELEESRSASVRLPGISEREGRALLSFLYTDSTEDATRGDIVVEMAFAADRLQLEALKRTCLQVISANIDAENVSSFLIVADQLRVPSLRYKCMAFATKNFAEVSATSGFQTLNPELRDEVQLLVTAIRESPLLGSRMDCLGFFNVREFRSAIRESHALQRERLEYAWAQLRHDMTEQSVPDYVRDTWERRTALLERREIEVARLARFLESFGALYGAGGKEAQ